MIEKTEENKEKVSSYLRQIVNDQNPFDENPLLAMYDKNSPHYKIVNSISDVLYKILTNKIVIVNKNAVKLKFFLRNKK